MFPGPAIRSTRGMLAVPYANAAIAAATWAGGTSNDCPPGGAQPSNRRPSSLRARSPSVRMREQISATAARSLANCERSERRKAKGEATHDRASNLLTGMVRRLTKPRDHRLHRCGSGLQAGLVGDESRGRASEDRRDPQAVFAQRPAARGEVNDAIDQADLRRQFHRTVQADDLHRLATGFEPRIRGPRILGRDP